MASKTRLEIKQEIRTYTGDFQGTYAEGAQDLVLDRLINDVTNDVCRATDAYYYGGNNVLRTTIINGRATYCAPALYKIVAVVVTDSSGFAYPLTVKRAREIDAVIGPYWRTHVAGTTSSFTGRPYYCYLEGENTVGLYPVPDYNTQVFAYTDLVIVSNSAGLSGLSSTARPFVAGDVGAFIFIGGGTGFLPKPMQIFTVSAGIAYVQGNAGTVGSIGGIGTLDTGGMAFEGYGVPPDWPLDTDRCPLQSENHMAVVYGGAVRYCELKKASQDDKERAIAAGLLPDMERHYREHRGMLEAEIGTQSQHSQGGGYGSFR